jgi:uncharacterized OB-fold protein
MSLENIGFCKEGEGAAFVAGGETLPGGRIPTNTHGGVLSHAAPGRSSGLLLVTEAVRQLYGACGPRQIDCSTALIDTIGGVNSSHGTLVVGREAAPFFEACARGELITQGCASCGHRQFYPRRWCLNCGGTDLGWIRVSGEAELITYSVVRRAPNAAHQKRVPYVIGVVKLAEGPQLLASIVNVDAAVLTPGMAVRIVPTVETGPTFEPARNAGS